MPSAPQGKLLSQWGTPGVLLGTVIGARQPAQLKINPSFSSETGQRHSAASCTRFKHIGWLCHIYI